MSTTRFPFLATASRGTETMAERELEALGLEVLEVVPGGVSFRGTLADGMRACLWSRIATRVLLELGQAKVAHEDDVYDAARALPVLDWFTPNSTLAVATHLSDNRFANSHFVSLRVKDAIVDVLRDACGRRPSVDTNNPDVPVSVHLVDGTARFNLVLNGAPLNRRGYRVAQGPAPLRESLAAALVHFSGWSGEAPLHDPMCGSGTIVIEAAQIAADIAPGLTRSFAFERWPAFDDALRRDWAGMLEQARARRRVPEVPILGSDYDAKVLGIARRNAAEAGVADLVAFHEDDARDAGALSPPGHFVLNPPYGSRMRERDGDAAETCEQFVRNVRDFAGHELTMLAPQALLKRAVHLRPETRIDVFNGAIRCQMARYRLGL